MEGSVYYRIRETDLNDRVFYSAIVHLGNTRNNKGVLLYPNPANDIITVSAFQSQNGPVEIRIYDAAGKIVKRISWEQEAGAYARTISLTGLSKGVYSIELNDRLSKKRSRLVKL